MTGDVSRFTCVFTCVTALESEQRCEACHGE
jgi:hypothetical protein